MGAKKGTDNAKLWRDQRVDTRKQLIEDALLQLSKRKDKIKSKKELVERLVLITGMNRTTFTRTGSKYAELILGFLNKQNGTAGSVSINDMNLEALRIFAKMKELEIHELAKDKAKLHKENKDLMAIKNVGNLTDISDTVMALLLVIERFSDFTSLDYDNNLIIDTTKDEDDPERIIASGARTLALFNTLKANPVLAGTPKDKMLTIDGEGHE